MDPREITGEERKCKMNRAGGAQLVGYRKVTVEISIHVAAVYLQNLHQLMMDPVDEI